MELIFFLFRIFTYDFDLNSCLTLFTSSMKQGSKTKPKMKNIKNFTAWDETEQNKENEGLRLELSILSEAKELFLQYAQDSTVQGLGYVFVPKQTIIGRLFWGLTVIFMFSLGVYWCQQAYLDWTDYPVLTTVTTTSYSVNEVK